MLDSLLDTEKEPSLSQSAEPKVQASVLLNVLTSYLTQRSQVEAELRAKAQGRTFSDSAR